MLNWNLADFLFFMVLAATIAIRRPHLKKYRAGRTTVSWFGLTEKLGLFLAFAGGFFLPVLYLFTPVFNFADYRVSNLSMALGVPVNLAALWLFFRAHRDLDRQWSPKLELIKKHQLVTTGVYASVRHPMYTSIFLFGLGQILLVGNWLVGPGYLVGFFVLYLMRIKNEEALLLDAFGEKYADYMKTTNRLFSWALLNRGLKSAA